MSNFGAYWLGAIVGLIFAVALGATLSVVTPLPGETPVKMAAAPEQQGSVEPSAPTEPETTRPAVEPTPVAEPASDPEARAAEAVTPEPAAEPEDSPTPTVTAEAEAAPVPAPAPETTIAAPAPTTVEVNALRDNSERYRGDESQPLLSIVLVGLGDPALNVAEIFLLPAPLSIVVDAKSENAEALIADARDAGFEVLVAVDQVAVANLDALLDDIGPVIGVATADNSVSSPELISDLMSGLITRSMGLFDTSFDGGGQTYRAAQSINLPAAPGGRRFDENQNSEAAYQALERAAFDARRAGAFVVYARPDPAIMTGLRRWMNLKANRSVALAPLSTVMRKLNRQ